MNRWYLLFSVCLVTNFGCDLADYHQRMDRQLARLEKWDKEQASLGAPLWVPNITNRGVHGLKSPYEMFFRPPANISKSLKLGEPPFGPGGILYRYPGTGNYNVFLGLKPLPKPPKPRAQVPDGNPVVGGNNPGDGDQFDNLTFLQKVGQGLKDFYAAEYKHDPKTVQFEFPEAESPRVSIEPFQIESPPLPKVTFQLGLMSIAGETQPKVQFRLYHLPMEKDSKELVIVFQIPLEKANDEGQLDLIRRSLKTFVFGQRARKRRIWYNRAYR
ncbi:MAG: hypothetical protein ACFCD0_28210 [Gemmataceae bacterium]